MNLKPILLSIALIFSLMITTVWANSVSYKWQDDDGNVAYSQTPPRDREYETIRTKASSSNSSSRTSKGTSSAVKALEDSAAARKVKEKDAQENAQIQKKRAGECDNAKKNVETFTIYKRVRQPDGSVIRLDDNDRARLLKEAQENVADLCS